MAHILNLRLNSSLQQESEASNWQHIVRNGLGRSNLVGTQIWHALCTAQGTKIGIGGLAYWK